MRIMGSQEATIRKSKRSPQKMPRTRSKTLEGEKKEVVEDTENGRDARERTLPGEEGGHRGGECGNWDDVQGKKS